MSLGMLQLREERGRLQPKGVPRSGELSWFIALGMLGLSAGGARTGGGCFEEVTVASFPPQGGPFACSMLLG